MLVALTYLAPLGFSGSPALGERAFIPLPLGSVTPRGWLLKQLKIQAEGLSGHLAQFWPDVQSSGGVGGGGDGGLHERTPYWLNGVVPLAFLLQNAGVQKLPKVAGIYKAADSHSWLHNDSTARASASHTYMVP